jgi:hypothetical protein
MLDGQFLKVVVSAPFPRETVEAVSGSPDNRTNCGDPAKMGDCLQKIGREYGERDFILVVLAPL